MNSFADLDLLKRTPRTVLNRFEDRSGNRFYWSNDKGVIGIYAGITSTLAQVMPESKYLTEWKLKQGANWKQVLKEAAEYGTMLHKLYVEWIKNKFITPTDYINTLEQMEQFCVEHPNVPNMSPDMPSKDLLSFIAFVEEYNVKPVLMEAMLISEPIGKYRDNQYAMTIDFLCEIEVIEKTKEEVLLGVFKSGKNKGKNKTKTVTKKTPRKKIALIDFKSNFFGKSDGEKSFFAAHKFQLFSAKKAVEYNFNGINVEIIANFSPSNWRKIPTFTYYQHDLSDDSDLWEFGHYLTLAMRKGLFRPHGRKLYIDNFESSKGYRFLGYEELIQEQIKNQI